MLDARAIDLVGSGLRGLCKQMGTNCSGFLDGAGVDQSTTAWDQWAQAWSPAWELPMREGRQSRGRGRSLEQE